MSIRPTYHKPVFPEKDGFVGEKTGSIRSSLMRTVDQLGVDLVAVVLKRQ